MAPEICSSSSDGGVRLRPEPPNRHHDTPIPRRIGTSFTPPADSSGPEPTVPDLPRRPATARARCRPGCDDGGMSADIVIRGGTVIDGTGSVGRPADVAITGGRHQRRGRRPRRHARPRRRRAGGEPRVHRHPHPLRRAGVLGPRPHPLVLPRRDHGGRRQLRVLHRPDPARRRGAPGPHAPARRGHELRHALGGRALGRVRDLPPVPRRRGPARSRAELRLLRRPHRGAPLRHGRGSLRTAGHRRGDRPHAGGGGRGHGGRRGRVRLERLADAQRRQRSAGAVPRGRPGRAARVAPTGQGVRPRRGGPAAGRCLLQPGGVRAPARDRPPLHLDGVAHGQGLPVPREGHRRARRRLVRRRARCGPRCRAARSCSR